MTSLQHWIITRFNLRISAPDNPEWLRNRISLFEKYCRPSVFRQTNMNFQWHIVFDRERIERHRDWLDDLRAHPNVVAHLLEADESLADDGKWVERLKASAEPGVDLLTTRLDNDDIIHSEMVDDLQKLVGERRKNGTCAFDFNRLVLWSPGDREMIRHRVAYTTAFVSLFEPAEREQTRLVFCAVHPQIGRQFPTVRSGKVRNMVVVHDENLRNSLSMSPLKRILRRMTGARVRLSDDQRREILGEFGVMTDTSEV